MRVELVWRHLALSAPEPAQEGATATSAKEWTNCKNDSEGHYNDNGRGADCKITGNKKERSAPWKSCGDKGKLALSSSGSLTESQGSHPVRWPAIGQSAYLLAGQPASQTIHQQAGQAASLLIWPARRLVAQPGGQQTLFPE